MTPLRLYHDEDSMDEDLIAPLRIRGLDIRTASEDGMLGYPDTAQLHWSRTQRRVLYSFNVGDFCALHAQCLQRGEQHAGIILARQRRHTVGDQLRGLVTIAAALSAEDMVDRLEFLSAWI